MGMATVEYIDPNKPEHVAVIENVTIEARAGIVRRGIDVVRDDGTTLRIYDVKKIVFGRDAKFTF